MIVRDLIAELEELPQDLPIVVNHKEVTDIIYSDATYVLNEYEKDYFIGSAIILE